MKETTIFRFKHSKEEPFTLVSALITADNRMSAKAQGILLQLLSNEDVWTLHPTELTRHFKDGLDSIKSGLIELSLLGYVLIIEPESKGKFEAYKYRVYECPLLNSEFKNISSYKKTIGKNHRGKILLKILKREFPNGNSTLSNNNRSSNNGSSKKKSRNKGSNTNKSSIDSNKPKNIDFTFSSLDQVRRLDNTIFFQHKLSIVERCMKKMVKDYFKREFQEGTDAFGVVYDSLKNFFLQADSVEQLSARLSSCFTGNQIQLTVSELRSAGKI